MSVAVLLNIQGKCAGLRAKSGEVSGHLPPLPKSFQHDAIEWYQFAARERSHVQVYLG
jgi:hypothetical protein